MSRELTTDDLIRVLDWMAENHDDPVWEGLRLHMKVHYDAVAEFKLAIQQKMMETQAQYYDSVYKEELERDAEKEEVSPVKFFETICDDCYYIWATTDWDSCPRCRGLK